MARTKMLARHPERVTAARRDHKAMSQPAFKEPLPVAGGPVSK